MTVQQRPEIRFLSELYAADVPSAVLLAEYPSSNSNAATFQNQSKYIIHDPFPPPPVELLKQLGPHHLMYGWGQSLPVTSDVCPPAELLEHWERVLGAESCPHWQPLDSSSRYVTLFPLESISADRQVVDPEVNYAIHSKEVIQQIDCAQADVLPSVVPPCIVKLSHGYAGLGNFLVNSPDDEAAMRQQLAAHWPDAVLVVNSVIQDIAGDFGVQFYLHRDGQLVWLGFTEQAFNDQGKWCGGSYSADSQIQQFDQFCKMIEPVGRYLHSVGYFGVVGIDILCDRFGQQFLVDVNPRLTGISPFLMASRMFAQDGLRHGVYRASCSFPGSMSELFETVENQKDVRVTVLSVVENPNGQTTICHLAANSDSHQANHATLDSLTVPNL